MALCFLLCVQISYTDKYGGMNERMCGSKMSCVLHIFFNGLSDVGNLKGFLKSPSTGSPEYPARILMDSLFFVSFACARGRARGQQRLSRRLFAGACYFSVVLFFVCFSWLQVGAKGSFIFTATSSPPPPLLVVRLCHLVAAASVHWCAGRPCPLSILTPTHLPTYARHGQIWVGIVLVNVVTGLMVDGFSAIRQAAESRINTLQNDCFVCGLDRASYEDIGLGPSVSKGAWAGCFAA